MRFVTMFPETENVHIIKDVGMIPYIMHKEFSFDSRIACYKNGEYPYLSSEAKGLKIDFIKKYTGKSILDGAIYLLKNSKDIDVLHIFHFNKRTALWVYLYKILNKKGKAYLKLDADFRIKTTTNPNNKSFKAILKRIVLNKFDLISVETTNIYNFLKNSWNINVEYIPNGFYDYGKREIISYEHKKNVILTVGRIGTYQKATETLLEGFKLAAEEIDVWKLKIIGPIEEDFKDYISSFIQENPNLKEKIEFTGPIYDRKKLEEEYIKSKIFCLTSRYESFGLVFLEAMKAGCYIVSSDFDAAYDITNNEKYGHIFKIGNTKELAECLIKSCNNDKILKDNFSRVQQYAYENFYWPRICKSILGLLNREIN